jgi:hypothetical protein
MPALKAWFAARGRACRFAGLLACAALLPVSHAARADLYRWVDPETGSIKYSNHPPLVSPAARGPAPKVEVIPYRPPGSAAPATQTADPAAANAAANPAAKAASQAAAKPPAEPGALASLEARWRTMLESFGAPAAADFQRSGEGIRQHVEAYKAVSAELDRMDPAGAARRRAQAEESGLLERFVKGIGAGMAQQPIKK